MVKVVLIKVFEVPVGQDEAFLIAWELRNSPYGAAAGLSLLPSTAASIRRHSSAPAT